MAKDPFSIVYEAITNEFKTFNKNVVEYTTKRNPKQDVVTTADLAEIIIVPETANIGQQNASCGDDVEFTFQVMVNVGDQRLTPKAFPLMWSILGAYRNLRFKVLEHLEYKGHAFVNDVIVGTATMDLGGAERGMFGWACLWPITVKMYFDKEDMK